MTDLSEGTTEDPVLALIYGDPRTLIERLPTADKDTLLAELMLCLFGHVSRANIVPDGSGDWMMEAPEVCNRRIVAEARASVESMAEQYIDVWPRT